jgi:hypothetical protein
MKVKSQRIFARRWTHVFVKYSTLKIGKKFTVLLRLRSDSEQKPFVLGLCTLYSENQIINESNYAYLLIVVSYPFGGLLSETNVIPSLWNIMRLYTRN